MKESKKIPKNKKISTIFLSREKDYFVENLSMLVAGGMPIIMALNSMEAEARSARMKKIILRIKEEVETGSTLHKALEGVNLFPAHVVSLIRLGEESGRLVENLKVISVEQEKNRSFRSKLHSAMMYPIFVLSLTAFIGVGISWFILPKLSLVFSQLKVDLPLITELLIKAGVFLSQYGQYVIPAMALFFFLLFFFLFSFSKTKFIGQYIVFFLPGIRGLMKEVEIARFGYLLGTLLEAGLPINDALSSLASATEIPHYRKLYIFMHDNLEEGNSLQKSMNSSPHIRRLIPAPIEQLIAASEQSGTLSETLLKIGKNYENKSDNTTKNLSVILEPVLLVLVWLGVVGVALAVILPIYSLVGGYNSGVVDSPPPTQKVEDVNIIVDENPEEAKNILPLPPKMMLKISSTGLGYLNVRDMPSTQGKIISQVSPEEQYEYVTVENGWYEILFDEDQYGWVIEKYIEVIEEDKTLNEETDTEI